MMHWGDGIGFAGAWLVACGAIAVMVLLTCAVALTVMGLRGRGEEAAQPPAGPATDLERELKLRLARGEISVDEFERERDALRR